MAEGLRVLDIVKSKNFLILVLFILATSISLWLVSMPTPNIRTIVSETHKQISNLKNMNMMNMNRDGSNGRAMTVDETMETYLELLGFTSNPKLYSKSVEPQIPVPVIATGVTSRNYKKSYSLIDSVRRYLPDKQVMIFDLGLGSYELVKLKKHCNISTLCKVKSFDFDKFPSHIRDMDIKAYKPLAVQEALNEFGAIIWTDSEDYFVTSHIEAVLKKAERVGIAAWPIETSEPTSALTHSKMFAYFKTRQDLYFFHHMVSSSHLVLYNIKVIHSKLMLPWVQCALTSSCIWPRGAQNVGCNWQRKPLYRYSGCHRYDASALNVILGLMFGYESESYTVSEEVFGVEEEEAADNSTVKVKH